MSAIPRAHPRVRAGLVRPPFAVPHGPRDQKTKLSEELDSGLRRNDRGVCLASAAMRPLLRTGVRVFALRVPLGRGEGAKEKPVGARARCPRVRCRHTDVPSANPVAHSRSRRAGARRPRPRGCLFSGLLLFGQAKRSDPAARRADGKTHGCVLGENRTDQSKATANGSRLPPG